MRTLFAICVLTVTVMAVAVGAQEISYQGELRDGGVPFDGTAAMKFVIIDDDTGLAIWSSDGSVDPGDPPMEPDGSVDVLVGDGLFSVVLGLEPGMVPIAGADALNLGRSSLRMWVSTGGTFERLSDQMLASSPSSLSVRQVDPDATGRLARWDGMKLVASASIAEDEDGLVTVGSVGDPLARLHVSRSFRVSRGTSNQAIAMSNDGFGNAISGLSEQGNQKALIFQSLSVDDGRPPAGATGFRWFMGPQTAAQLVMTIDQDGEVGIGTDNPLTMLDVAGIVRSRGGFRFPDGTIQTTAQLAGPKGDKGDKGDQGDPGEQGPPGPAVTLAAFCGVAPGGLCRHVCDETVVDGNHPCTAVGDGGSCSTTASGQVCCVCALGT